MIWVYYVAVMICVCTGVFLVDRHNSKKYKARRKKEISSFEIINNIKNKERKSK